jgi:ABC-type multidrug transport system fused ATPase/permease subunit
MLWSAVAALSLCLLVCIIGLLADLQATRGQVTIPSKQVKAIGNRLGEASVPALAVEGEQAGDVHISDSGILPAVVAAEGRQPWETLLTRLYAGVPGLRNNVSALSYLVLLGAVTGIVFTVALSRARARSLQAALVVVGRQRTHVHRQAMRLGPGDLRGKSRQTVHSLFTTEIDRLRDGITEWMQSVPRDPVVLVLLLLLALSLDWRLTLLCLVPLAFCWWFVHREYSWGRLRRELADARAESELRLLAESLNKARIVRGYGMEEYEQQQFAKHLDRFTNGVARGLRQERLLIWVSRVAIVACVGLILHKVGEKGLTLSNPLPVFAAVTLLLTFGCLLVAAEYLLRLRKVRAQVESAASHVLQYLDQIPEVGQAVGAKFLEPVSKSIIMESVNYRWDGTLLLNDLDLRLAAGTSTAIVSVDPLQAKAVAYLLPRFVEPTTGRVLFDSEDINWGTLESLRAETVFVGGSDPFFTGTVLENITCGQKHYGLQEATEAAKSVHAHKFITRLPQGYETLLGEHGEDLEVGQAFLLGLARAALRKPAVLIIEEPVARLDDDTKALLDDAYNRLVKGRTVIFLPSRLSTVRRCDQVALINNGKVEALGPHSELLKKSEVYRHWEYITFNAFQQQEAASGRAAAS